MDICTESFDSALRININAMSSKDFKISHNVNPYVILLFPISRAVEILIMYTPYGFFVRSSRIFLKVSPIFSSRPWPAGW